MCHTLQAKCLINEREMFAVQVSEQMVVVSVLKTILLRRCDIRLKIQALKLTLINEITNLAQSCRNT